MENNDNLSQRQLKNTTKIRKCQAIFINLVKESFSLVKDLVKERSSRFGLQFGLRPLFFGLRRLSRAQAQYALQIR